MCGVVGFSWRDTVRINKPHLNDVNTQLIAWLPCHSQQPHPTRKTYYSNNTRPRLTADYEWVNIIFNKSRDYKKHKLEIENHYEQDLQWFKFV